MSFHEVSIQVSYRLKWVKHEDTAKQWTKKDIANYTKNKSSVSDYQSISPNILSKGISLFYQAMFCCFSLSQHCLTHSFCQIITFLWSDIWPALYEDWEWGFLEKDSSARAVFTLSRSSLSVYSFLERKSQHICPDPHSFHFNWFLIILEATWIQIFFTQGNHVCSKGNTSRKSTK